jgi:hypothetical protein
MVCFLFTSFCQNSVLPDAIRQLTNTISRFNFKLSRNYPALNLEAYVCTPEFYPKLDSSWQALAIEFVEDYDGIELFERNYKTCK